jgi:AAA15 family ATPase/GTPase
MWRLNMLLEFRVRNFRSFKDEAVLSLVASNDKSLQESNTLPTNLTTPPEVLRSLVVYGGNASGKTNLLLGLDFLRAMVINSPTHQPGHRIKHQPFRLDSKSPNEPTGFEISALIDGVKYRYGFEFNANRILGEWLYVNPKGKPQRWFDRTFENGNEVYEFSSFFAGQKKVWQDATRPNVLFLSTAVQLNSEQLRPLYDWLTNSLVTILERGAIWHKFSTEALLNPESKEAITAMINSADIAVSAIGTVKIKGLKIEIVDDKLPSPQINEDEELFPVFTHKAGDIEAKFDFMHDESSGTQKLFSLAGPLLDIITRGRCLIIDELDGSLHPLLVRKIVELFHSPINKAGAQLIFSTHDTSLLDNSLMRRDQIWLTEKAEDQSSSLVPLLDFSPRKGEALEKGYLSGRYGGIPILGLNIISDE